MYHTKQMGNAIKTIRREIKHKTIAKGLIKSLYNKLIMNQNIQKTPEQRF